MNIGDGKRRTASPPRPVGFGVADDLERQRRTRYVLLDRDGTIIADKHYLAEPDGVELIPGAAEGLRRILAIGFGIIIITNQSGVGRGYFDHEQVNAVNRRLLQLLEREKLSIDGIYYCPHSPDDGCSCRKPAPGLAETAATELGFELRNCVVIGDADVDIRMAKSVGAYSILVLTGTAQKSSRGRSSADCEPDFVAQNLIEAADHIALLWRRSGCEDSLSRATPPSK